MHQSNLNSVIILHFLSSVHIIYSSLLSKCHSKLATKKLGPLPLDSWVRDQKLLFILSLTKTGFTSRGEAQFDEAAKTMKVALENGSNIWNGGQFYGPPESNSLQLLNYYFTKHPEDKDRVYISMKGAFSFHPLGPDNSPENIRRSIDTCLKELDGKVFIDSWEPARSDAKVPIETTIETIAEYVKAGKIGGIGLSEVSPSTVRRAHAVHPISSVEVELSMFTTDP